MEIINEELDNETKSVNEMIISMQKSLPTKVTNNIYYTKLKYLMFNEIIKFCKEKIDLKIDLLGLKDTIGEFLSEEQILDLFNSFKAKYNDQNYPDIGVEFHVESTRLDYGVCVFIIIKRGDTIFCKKFIFRYRKTTAGIGLDFSGLNAIGMSVPELFKKNNDEGDGKNA